MSLSLDRRDRQHRHGHPVLVDSPAASRLAQVSTRALEGGANIAADLLCRPDGFRGNGRMHVPLLEWLLRGKREAPDRRGAPRRQLEVGLDPGQLSAARSRATELLNHCCSTSR